MAEFQSKDSMSNFKVFVELPKHCSTCFGRLTIEQDNKILRHEVMSEEYRLHGRCNDSGKSWYIPDKRFELKEVGT